MKPCWAALLLSVAALPSWSAAATPLNVVRVETVAGAPELSAASGYADGNGTNARFNYPRGVAVDSDTGIVYISDYNN